MNIVLITLAVIVAMCALFVFFIFTQAECKAALEPELLVFDKPLTDSADFEGDEETSAEKPVNLLEAV
jgi:hypothetical protein